MVRQSIDVGERLRIEGRAFTEGDNPPFGTPRHRAGQMGGRRRRCAARQNEGSERRQSGVHVVDLAFQAGHLRGDDSQRRVFWVFRLGRRQIGTQVEKIILNAAEHGVDLGPVGKMAADHADHAVQLIDVAKGRRPRAVLGDALTVAQRGLAAIAATGIDLVQFDHALSEPLGQHPGHEQHHGEQLAADAITHQHI